MCYLHKKEYANAMEAIQPIEPTMFDLETSTTTYMVAYMAFMDVICELVLILSLLFVFLCIFIHLRGRLWNLDLRSINKHLFYGKKWHLNLRDTAVSSQVNFSSFLFILSFLPF